MIAVAAAGVLLFCVIIYLGVGFALIRNDR